MTNDNIDAVNNVAGSDRLPLNTQLTFWDTERNEQINQMNLEQLWWRTNSDNLREKGSRSKLPKEEMRELSAYSLIQTFRALTGTEGPTDFLCRRAQETAIAKCMTGDMEGLFEDVGISTEAFLDEVVKAFPPYGPYRNRRDQKQKIRESLIKFAELVVARYESIKLEDERERLENRAELYDLDSSDFRYFSDDE